MEPLLKQLRELPKRFGALSAGARWGIIGALVLVVIGVVTATLVSDSGTYQYVFTNLSAEDSSEAASVLKGAGVPFRAEANGSALAVPASKVHEARLMLAAAGLPRGGGVGFEIFDRGDLGISEFTQKVNLRRAIEGELARTIGRLGPVRSARVHITLPEKGLYRNEDRKAAAAVVLNLQPGRNVEERELAGVRHLVSAAVAGLSPDAVTVMDGRGTVLAGDRSEGAKLAGEQRDLESGLEQRIVELLEPVVGRGAVVAKVTATLDTREVESTADNFDPDTAAVRSERKVAEQVSADSNGAGAGVAGAAANQPLASAGGTGTAAPSNGNRSQTTREDDLKNYELSKTTTHTLAKGPRLTRLSAAVLIGGVGGKARSDAELKRLGDLAKHAVGFDAQRGDQFDISSEPFVAETEAAEAPIPLWKRPELTRLVSLGVGVLLALVFAAVFLLRSRGARTASSAAQVALLKPGAKVGEVEASMNLKLNEIADVAKLAAAAKGEQVALNAVEAKKPVDDMQTRARLLTEKDPARAAHLLRAWIMMDIDSKEGSRG